MLELLDNVSLKIIQEFAVGAMITAKTGTVANMRKPVCVKCRLFYKVEKNGYMWIEGMPTDEGWKPYKIWHSDLWKCRGCGSEIVIGHGLKPWCEHYEEGFKEELEKLGPIIQVNDC